MRRALAVIGAAGLVLGGCAARPPAVGELSGTVTVFAAASLTETFDAIADEFERRNPGVTVQLNFGGSSGLAAQIVEGAPVDVFAAANEPTMSTVRDAALVDGDPAAFATNTLEIAVPAGNPAGIVGLADFANPELSIAICAAEVPCGAASTTVFDEAGIVAAPDTLEQDVKAVLTRVELGEVDAGLVYATDVRSAGAQVDGIRFSEASAAIGTYPIARLAASTHKDAAAAFIAYVLSPDGKRIFARAGFGTP